jgi:hypothetical protein
MFTNVNLSLGFLFNTYSYVSQNWSTFVSFHLKIILLESNLLQKKTFSVV